MHRRLKYLGLMAAFFLISFQMNAQCAMCKAVVENGDVSMAEGVNSGITYLMVFPYILVGVLLYVLYRYKKTAKN
jgi:hypothetical protein